MKYRTLTGTGISISNLALGTMGFGTETDEAAAFAILDRFVEADGNLIDTANVYGDGASEELLGRWFASRNTEVTGRVVLATKARFGTSAVATLVERSTRTCEWFSCRTVTELMRCEPRSSRSSCSCRRRCGNR
jgi:aryl-alcohol dehydrogenase-like predicted oxidoreductase